MISHDAYTLEKKGLSSILKAISIMTMTAKVFPTAFPAFLLQTIKVINFVSSWDRMLAYLSLYNRTKFTSTTTQ